MKSINKTEAKRCGKCGSFLNEQNWRKAERNSEHSLCASCANAYRRSHRRLPKVIEAEKAQHKSWLVRNAAKARIYLAVHNLRTKLTVLRHYSNSKPSCKNCGFDILSALALDHINDDGMDFKRKSGIEGHELYWYLIKHEFPGGFQVLCSNCNHLKRLNRRRNYYEGARFQLDLKREAIEHYTKGTMACQDPYHLHERQLQDIRLLSLDHLSGGGRAERMQRGHNLYWWLAQGHYPSGYRIICMNCQMIAYEEERFRKLLRFLDSARPTNRGGGENA